jgi:mannose-6-phosphate isomerase-like protein (cupin superfamily)
MSEYSLFRVISRHADEATRYRLNPEEEIVLKVSSKETGGAYCVLEHRGGLQVAPPVHLHRKADEIFEVLEGRVGFWLAGQVIEATPGMTVVIPKNMPHAWRNLGNTATRMIVTFIPGGTDGFFEAAEGILHSDPRAAILAEQYDTVYVDAPVEAKLWDAASSEPVPMAAD